MPQERINMVRKFFCDNCDEEIKNVYFVCVVDDKSSEHYFILCSSCGKDLLDQLRNRTIEKDMVKKREEQLQRGEVE